MTNPFKNNEQLKSFYASPVGSRVVSIVTTHLQRVWKKNTPFLGVGYVIPFMQAMLSASASCQKQVGLLPKNTPQPDFIHPQQQWLHLPDSETFPVTSGEVDFIFLIHCLEQALYPQHMLREVWRTLKPEGRALIFLTRSTSAWTQEASSPFASKDIFNESEIKELVAQSHLTPLHTQHLLCLSPETLSNETYPITLLEQTCQKIPWGFQGALWALEVKKSPALSVPTASKNSLFSSFSLRGSS